MLRNPRSILPLALACLALTAGCLGATGPVDPEGGGPGGSDAPPGQEVPGFTPDLDRPLGDVRRFAAIPPVPGYPEGLHLWEDRVFVGTLPYDHPDEAPVLYVLDRATGAIVEEVPVAVEERGGFSPGLAGFTVDGLGRPYAGEVGSLSVLRWSPAPEGGWVQETYAVLPDLPSCQASAPPCSPTRDDRAPVANDLVFDEAGNLYATDSFQATIWKVPPGPGPGPREPVIWFQDARIDHQFGPNGIRISPDGTSVVFDVTGPIDPPVATGLGGALPGPAGGVAGDLTGDGLVVYRLPFVDAPRAEHLEVFHWFEPTSFPDGLTFGASGNLYVNLLGRNQVAVLDTDGDEIARLPSPAQGQASDPPVDFPASLVFDDARRALLVTNYAALTTPNTGDRSHFAVLDIFVDDTSAPLARPVVP